MSGAYIILRRHSKDSRRMRPFPPDEDFNYVILAIVVVAMLFSASNWWRFYHGLPLAPDTALPMEDK